ncbi:MAG: M55 family metallopeptidase [Thermodesulfobacteriota bacterium]|nr:M55 family metallopeptidase [Thermodesulfobacteriota bacterium]
MHVAIFADLEGAFGVWRMRQCRTGTEEWQYGRECLTEDVNHAIKGVFDGGADKVTVKDTHDSGFNCIVNKLDKRAKYAGGHFTRPSLFGRVADYDLILYLAIHAASGTPDAFFPHTHFGIFSQVRLNGRAVCEMDLYGACLGEFGLPIGLVSGEDIAIEQALKVLPWAKTVIVDKRKETYTSGEESLKYLAQGRARLREASAAAVREAASMKPLVLPGPLHFEAEFRSEQLLEQFNTWDFKRDGRTVEWDADNMIECLENLNKLTFFPKKTYPFRGPIFFFRRNLYRIKTAYFAPESNPEGSAQP